MSSQLAYYMLAYTAGLAGLSVLAWRWRIVVRRRTLAAKWAAQDEARRRGA